MNAKVKVIAALAALQLMIPAVFAQGPGPLYPMTGVVLEVNASRIVIKSNGQRWTILRNSDTKVANLVGGRIRPGSIITIQYKMVAETIEITGTPRMR